MNQKKCALTIFLGAIWPEKDILLYKRCPRFNIKEFGIMWKLLSGIALILVLDIVFIWMMALEPDSPEIAQVIGPAAAVPVIHEQPSLQSESVDDSVEPTESKTDTLQTSRVSRAAKRAADRRFQASQTTSVTGTGATKLFQDTIIWIGRTEVPVKIEEREPIAIRSESRVAPSVQASIADSDPPREEARELTKKRSFQSKAIGVIKKPYDLIKAFADKFN